jgi:hypothetical protein
MSILFVVFERKDNDMHPHCSKLATDQQLDWDESGKQLELVHLNSSTFH